MYDLRSISKSLQDAAKEILEAKKPLHPNQQKIDVHEPEKDELTAKDFEMLRAGKKAKMKEEVEEESLIEAEVHALHPDPNKPDHVVHITDVKNSSDFIKRWDKEPSKSHKEFGYDYPHIKKSEPGFKHMTKHKMTYDQYSSLVKHHSLKEEVDLDEGEQGDLRRVSNRVMNKIGKKYGVNTQKTKYKAAAQNDAANTPSHMRKDITSSLRKMKEEVEQVDELKTSTLGSYTKKALSRLDTLSDMKPKFVTKTGKPTGISTPSIVKDINRQEVNRKKGITKALDRLAKEEVEQVNELKMSTLRDDADEILLATPIVVDIKESYLFGDYLTAAKDIVGEEQAIELANYAYNKQDTNLFVEQITRSDIQSKVATHKAAGHQVSEPKYMTKDGKLHAEYVVTDKETGIRRKYIHHGTSRKVENMGAKGKRDDE